MSNIPPEPSKDEINLLRQTTLDKCDAEGILSKLHPYDVNRFKKEDDYLRRFLMHHDNDQKLALEMAYDTLKWRMENKINEITEDSLDQTLLVERGSLVSVNRDIDGCKMLVFTVRKHEKGSTDAEKIKRILIYWIERLEREENGKWITVFFDMRETGIKHMDMDFIQYLINLFKFYYPWILNYIIVLEMPWLLNAMWKIIKGWLPPKSIEKIKFLDKKSLQTYVPEDQCLVEWGGTDKYVFKFEPEVRKPPTLGFDEIEKKVHFAAAYNVVQGDSPDITTTFSVKDGIKFLVEPQEELVFSSNKIGATASIFLTNKSEANLAYKIKTTSPDKFRVRPSMGVIEPNGQVPVQVTLNDQIAPGLLVRDKFLVIAVPCAVAFINQQEFNLLQENANKLDIYEIRLRVGIVNTESVETIPICLPPANPIPVELVSKIDQILTKQSVMEEKLSSLRRVIYVLLFLMISLLLVFVITTNNLTSSLLAAQASSSQSCFNKHSMELVDHRSEL